MYKLNIGSMLFGVLIAYIIFGLTTGNFDWKPFLAMAIVSTGAELIRRMKLKETGTPDKGERIIQLYDKYAYITLNVANVLFFLH